MHTARAQGCKSQWLCDKHNCPQRDSIPGHRALQSDMLPLDHCDLQYADTARYGDVDLTTTPVGHAIHGSGEPETQTRYFSARCGYICFSQHSTDPLSSHIYANQIVIRSVMRVEVSGPYMPSILKVSIDNRRRSAVTFCRCFHVIKPKTNYFRHVYGSLWH